VQPRSRDEYRLSTAYIMEDPREAMRLELKVDPEAWVRKYLAHRVPPGAKFFRWVWPGVILREVCAIDSSITGTGIDISAERVQEAIRKNPANSRLKSSAETHTRCNSHRTALIWFTPACYSNTSTTKNKPPPKWSSLPARRVVLLQDLDGQLLWNYPEDPVVQCAVEKVWRFSEHGFRPFCWSQAFLAGT